MNAMLFRTLLMGLMLIFSYNGKSQLKSGPMLGPVDLKTAWIWCELEKDAEIELVYWKSSDPKHKKELEPVKSRHFNYIICKFYLTALDFGTEYQYALELNDKRQTDLDPGRFTTQDLWQYRKPPPDFSFLSGSCAYFNDPVNDRPGKPYGGDSSIFYTMAKEPSAFMLWLGDNWYYREVDYGSLWGLWNRASKCRASTEMQSFWKSTSHLAIWDDHDFGPNNAGVGYVFKDEATQVFNAYWCNPPCPDHQGVYTKYSYHDIDIFMMDDRTFRWSDEMHDSINGTPNVQKRMWGQQQLDWLKNELANSKASFKIIANGSNVLNNYNKHDCLVHYPVEYHELLDFLSSERINGVLFMTGDRHHSEVIRKKLNEGYYTYDITNSSLTSGIYRLNDIEKSNPDLLLPMLVEQNNYTRVSISGPLKDRNLKLEFVDPKGKTLAAMDIKQTELMFGK